MMWRIITLVLVVALAFAIVRMAERRRSGRGRAALPAGLTLVTGPGCALCPQAIEAARQLPSSVRVVDVRDVESHAVRSLPTAFVTGAAGDLIARRSGRAVISDLPKLAELAQAALR